MMHRSKYIMARPIVTLLFFEATAATISVPPVEPLCTNTRPMPRPQSTAPIITFIKVSPTTGGCLNNGWKNANITEITTTPKSVRNTNVLPTIFHAIASSRQFTVNIVTE